MTQTPQEWLTDPPRFAQYVHEVRCTRAGPLLYLYGHLAVKRLPLLGQPEVLLLQDGPTLSINFWPGDPDGEPLWPEPWPDVPTRVRLVVRLPDDLAGSRCVLAESSRYEVFALVVADSESAGRDAVPRDPVMPPVYVDREETDHE